MDLLVSGLPTEKPKYQRERSYLVSMGFDEADAEAALADTNGDTLAAAELLIHGAESST